MLGLVPTLIQVAATIPFGVAATDVSDSEPTPLTEMSFAAMTAVGPPVELETADVLEEPACIVLALELDWEDEEEAVPPFPPLFAPPVQAAKKEHKTQKA
jgi:hypothetical protein